jgi:chromosomal replication initiator protein
MTKYELIEFMKWREPAYEIDDIKNIVDTYWESQQVRIRGTAENILFSVASFANIEPDEIRTRTRKRNIIELRQISMYLIRKKTNLSLNQIGYFFHTKDTKGFDHATCLHAFRTVENLNATDKVFNEKFEAIKKMIEE